MVILTITQLANLSVQEREAKLENDGADAVGCLCVELNGDFEYVVFFG